MEQYIGDGASLFITIVAIIIGLGAGLNVLDVRKESNKEKAHED